jgi:hypothetical protein
MNRWKGTLHDERRLKQLTLREEIRNLRVFYSLCCTFLFEVLDWVFLDWEPIGCLVIFHSLHDLSLGKLLLF